MADAINQTCLVVSLLVEHAVEIGVDLIDIGPVRDLLLEMMKHVDRLDIGATMQRPLERADSRSYTGVGVGAG